MDYQPIGQSTGQSTSIPGPLRRLFLWGALEAHGQQLPHLQPFGGAGASTQGAEFFQKNRRGSSGEGVRIYPDSMANAGKTW